MSLIKKIKDYYKTNKTLLFTTPSHSQGEFINETSKEMLGEKFFKCDFSEIEGFDDLRNPKGILKEVQNKISKVYSSKQSFMLTNGSTSGIVTLMLTTLKDNDEVLIARNCHVSVYNGLVLTGAKPVWIVPDYDKEWDIYKGITPLQVENHLKENKNIKAMILTSPTYEGFFSNIEAISSVTSKYNVKLIVDEAHGALLNFGDFKVKPAILCGADASVQSLHKTAGAPNPCALLHISQNSSIKPKEVQDALNLTNTTSPSYPLLLAIEATVDFLDSKVGRNKVEELLSNIETFKKSLKAACLYEGTNDTTKLLIKFQNINSLDAAEILNNNYKIEEEFSNNKAMLFITGIGTTERKLKKLSESLNDIESN